MTDRGRFRRTREQAFTPEFLDEMLHLAPEWMESRRNAKSLADQFIYRFNHSPQQGALYAVSPEAHSLTLWTCALTVMREGDGGSEGKDGRPDPCVRSRAPWPPPGRKGAQGRLTKGKKASGLEATNGATHKHHTLTRASIARHPLSNTSSLTSQHLLAYL